MKSPGNGKDGVVSKGKGKGAEGGKVSRKDKEGKISRKDEGEICEVRGL